MVCIWGANQQDYAFPEPKWITHYNLGEGYVNISAIQSRWVIIPDDLSKLVGMEIKPLCS